MAFKALHLSVVVLAALSSLSSRAEDEVLTHTLRSTTGIEVMIDYTVRRDGDDIVHADYVHIKNARVTCSLLPIDKGHFIRIQIGRDPQLFFGKPLEKGVVKINVGCDRESPSQPSATYDWLNYDLKTNRLITEWVMPGKPLKLFTYYAAIISGDERLLDPQAPERQVFELKF